MNADLVLFGRRVDMARRARRRTLVIAVYSALAVLMAVLWYFTHWRGTGAYLFWAAMLACKLFFGGYYRGGLVKPFRYKKPVNADAPPPLLALKLGMYKPVLQAEEDAFRSDERELHQRDHAHYQAYQWIGSCVVVTWFVAYSRMIQPRLVLLPGMTADEFYVTVALIGVMLVMTLPQAILLWTEPDMEEDSDR